jgi:hypothetical protein
MAQNEFIKTADLPVAAMDRLRRQVGSWAQENFGDNLTDLLPTFTVDIDGAKDALVQVPLIQVSLGSLAPLMGLVEELGELTDAPDEDEELDAIGDMGIYLCDYVSREGLSFHGCISDAKETIEVSHPSASLGRLYHCTLKRFQGIRGMDDLSAFRAAQKTAVAGLLADLTRLSAQGYSKRFDDIVANTWSAIVKKRNWKLHKENGNVEVIED